MLCFLELSRINSNYEEKVREKQPGHGSDSDLFTLSWEIEELNNLIKEIRKICPNIRSIIEHLGCPDFDMQQNNIPRQLSNIRATLVKINKSVSQFKRSPATHMFVVMISSELRNRKPYALPLQCLPCSGLKESDIRRIVKEVVKAMVDQNMKVCGK